MSGARTPELLWLGLGAATLVAALLLSPTPGGGVALFGFELPDVCPMQRTFDTACPTCGMTRAFVYAARGSFGAAASASPAGLLLFALLTLQIPYRILRLARPGLFRPGRRAASGAIAGFVLLALAVWGARLLGWLPQP